MLKVFVATSISIASLLSITSIADAGSIAPKSTHHSNINTMNLIAPQSNSNVPVLEVTTIHKVLTDTFRAKNVGSVPKIGQNGATSFIEIQDIKLLSYDAQPLRQAEKEAKVTFTEIYRTYSFRTEYYPVGKLVKGRIIYDNTNYPPRIRKQETSTLTKINGKWHFN